MADSQAVSLSGADLEELTARADAAEESGKPNVNVRAEVLRELVLMAQLSRVLEEGLRNHRDRMNEHGHAFDELVAEVNEVLGE